MWYISTVILGGGCFNITVTHTIRIEGRLSANGEDGTSSNGGGGAGWFLIISLLTLVSSLSYETLYRIQVYVLKLTLPVKSIPVPKVLVLLLEYQKKINVRVKKTI